MFAKLGASANELPVLVVGNKLDLISEMRPSVTNDDELYEFVSRHGLWKGYDETSPRNSAAFSLHSDPIALLIFILRSLTS